MADNITVTVGTTPTILYQALGPNRETLMIDNAGSATITLGGPNVVAGHGPQLPMSSTPTTLTVTTDIIYAIAPSGTATVYVAHWDSGGD